MPTPTSHLCPSEGAGGRECKYAGTPLTRSKVCHCEVGSWRRLCVHPYLTICPPTKPLILPSTTPLLPVPCSPLKTNFATVATEAQVGAYVSLSRVRTLAGIRAAKAGRDEEGHPAAELDRRPADVDQVTWGTLTPPKDLPIEHVAVPNGEERRHSSRRLATPCGAAFHLS